MPVIDEIRTKVAAGDFEYSEHATDQSILRRITVQEFREVIAVAEIIEEYPNDKYGPSCLMLGFTRSGRPIHIQCSDPSRPILKIITLYEPDSLQWIEFRTRRR